MIGYPDFGFATLPSAMGRVQPDLALFDGIPAPIGDIVICVTQAWRQLSSTRCLGELTGDEEISERLFEDLFSEIIVLFVHGFCHLLGFDHQDDSETQEMIKAEHILLRLVHMEHLSGLIERSG